MQEQSEHTEKLNKAEKILGHEFSDRSLLLTALTHPSAAEGHSISDSYERLEFLGDSILGAIVSYEAYHAYANLDEGGLTRIKVSLVSGASLSEVGKELGLADCIFLAHLNVVLVVAVCILRWKMFMSRLLLRFS